MIFESVNSILYSDTLVSDIFITEYLPTLDGDHVKLYLYIAFLIKKNKQSTIKSLSKKLDIEYNKSREILSNLENLGLLKKAENKILLVDLKEKEIKKLYRPLLNGSIENAEENQNRNKKRLQTIKAINNTFFSGVMSPSWYLDIDLWFDRYKFEEDVMYSLFQHCYDHKALSKNYIIKVAEDWHIRGICDAFELDNYFMEYQKTKDIRVKIYKRLKRKSPFTDFEEKYIEKWLFDYKFNIDIIDMALEKTTAISEPNFRYIDAILKKWFENKLTSINMIKEWEVINFGKRQKTRTTNKISQTEQAVNHRYDDEFYENLLNR
jgi:DnaD/phage-associated family protein